MEDGTADLTSAIGDRVRRERQSRSWTLDQLATASDVSRRMVVNIEQGSVNPSIGTLLRLAGALGVGLPALVEPPRSAPMAVTRRGESAALWTSPAGGRALLVASAGRPDATELWDWMLAPGDLHTSEAHTPGTRELLHVLEGAVTVESGQHATVLEPGDAVAFAGDVAHSYSNAGGGPARFSLAVFEPGVASSPLERSSIS